MSPNYLKAQLAGNSSAIKLSWQPPLALIIDMGISYCINFSISIENFTNYISDMTNNLTYIYDIEEQCDDVHINISIYAQNKVGRSNEIMKKLLLNNNQCTTVTVTVDVTTYGKYKYYNVCVYTAVCPKVLYYNYVVYYTDNTRTLDH